MHDSMFLAAGERAYYAWQELKAHIPLLRYFGSQLFVSIRKLAG